MPKIHLKRTIKDEAYFCPYCKLVFKKPKSANEGTIVDNYSYQCPTKVCGKYFNKDTYKEKSGNGLKYHYSKHSKLTVEEIITKHIINLLLKGVSQKDIHEITHFSRERIDKALQSYFNHTLTFTFDTFKKEYLEDTGTSWKDIVNAIEKGCGYRITSNLYNASNTTIKKALERSPVTIDYSVRINQKDNMIIVKSHKEENFFS